MMFSIALRFIPTTAEEAEKIVVAQTARGARFDEGGVVRRARAWVPVLIPLFVNLFRRADRPGDRDGVALLHRRAPHAAACFAYAAIRLAGTHRRA